MLIFSSVPVIMDAHCATLDGFFKKYTKMPTSPDAATQPASFLNPSMIASALDKVTPPPVH